MIREFPREIHAIKGLAYYNDQFDLKPGDRVYVDGKLEGQLGIVTAVNYNFKIKLSEYKRVIALVKTDVHGKFYMAGSHFVTFDPNVLSPAQATLWFRAPASEEEEYAQTGCFAAICKETLFAFAISGKECGSFTM